MIKTPKKSVSVMLPLDVCEQLSAYAGQTGRTVPAYIRQIIKRCQWHIENAPDTLTGKWLIT